MRFLLQLFVNNKPLILFINAHLLASIGTGMWFGLIFIFVDAYLGQGEIFSQMFMLAFAAGIMATPIWYKAANRIGKKTTWALALGLVIISFIYTGTLAPGEVSFTKLVSLKVIQTLGYTCIIMIAPAMLAEIADYDTWKTGTERTATYFSLYTFITKTSTAIGSALGLGIAGWYGFDAASTMQSKDSVWGLTLAISWVPTIFAGMALIFIALSPINARNHAIIRRRLDARAARTSTFKKPHSPTISTADTPDSDILIHSKI